MKNTVVPNEVFNILRRMGLKAPSNDTQREFYQDCLADSLDTLEFVSKLEDQFGIRILDTDIPKGDFTIGFMIEICQEKINDKIMQKYIDSVDRDHV